MNRNMVESNTLVVEEQFHNLPCRVNYPRPANHSDKSCGQHAEFRRLPDQPFNVMQVTYPRVFFLRILTLGSEPEFGQLIRRSDRSPCSEHPKEFLPTVLMISGYRDTSCSSHDSAERRNCSVRIAYRISNRNIELTLSEVVRFLHERTTPRKMSLSTSTSKLTSRPSWVTANEKATAWWPSAILVSQE